MEETVKRTPGLVGLVAHASDNESPSIVNHAPTPTHTWGRPGQLQLPIHGGQRRRDGAAFSAFEGRGSCGGEIDEA